MDSDTGTLGAACCQYVRGGELTTRARPLGSVSISKCRLVYMVTSRDTVNSSMKIFMVPIAVCTALHCQDSRVGFGFRIGPNADAQVLVELGPQTNTTPLGANSEKRQTKGPAERVRQRDKLFKQWLEMMRNRLNHAISSNVVTTNNNETKYD
ncbi:uncharacterized protein LOC124357405 isoform X2 [Homalodisca vitripennis]|uniref:uncharacterized protein LOC124357405 isoform X2 n=1 Tax=Homalodisca vitripennis TaxID=197043 RepID=UPI001EEC5404|nr:uncharacterized protein LOC124357405 isoform X2 [Homalodisca vitripennis]